MLKYLLPVAVIYFLLINLITFIVFGVDKRKAKRGKWRIPESTLLLLCFLGGGVGGQIAMNAFRHKTQHLKFTLLVPFSIILWCVVILFTVWRFRNAFR